MHRAECQVETEQHQPEMDLPEMLVHNAAGELGEPVVETPKSPNTAPEDHVVEMGHDVIGIRLLPIGGNDGMGDPESLRW